MRFRDWNGSRHEGQSEGFGLAACLFFPMNNASRFPWIAAVSVASLLAAKVTNVQAAPKAGPLRVLYFDAAGEEKLKNGPLHHAMRELGRDAIYFDQLTSRDGVTTAQLDLYDVVLRRAVETTDAPQDGVWAKQVTIPVGEQDGPEAVKVRVLAAVSGERKAAWEKFLAGREPERREKDGNVANYEKRAEPLTFQHPYSPKGAMERIQVPADMRLELFASEPDIAKPIAFAWDERGRLWVAETRDYPHEVRADGRGADSIKICEDTDGDGKADKFTVFADGLNIPTGLVFTAGGVVVAQPPSFLFLKDTDGDGKADVRETIFEGMWGIGDTHAQAGNLHYGLDNWLYGAVGYSGFRGKVGGQDLDFRMGSYRFRRDGSALEFLHQFSNNTWAQSFNDAGDQFGGTANNAPIFYGGIPATVVPKGVKAMTASKINVIGEAHAVTPNFRQVDVMGGYTAAAGSWFVGTTNMPERVRGNALVCEPTMKLVALMDVQKKGAGYTALDGKNIFASSDEWTSPVYAEVGPDGAVWIADFQNFIIQHNPTPSVERGGYAAKTGVGGAHENPLRDHSRGRIYRVVWNQAQKPAIATLAGATDAALVEALDDGNQFWRLTAQRLMVEGARKDAAPALVNRVKRSEGGLGAVHAMWTLHGMGLLDADTHLAALRSGDAVVRRNAVRALGSDDTARQRFFAAGSLADVDPHNRLAAMVKLAEFSTTPELQVLVRKLVSDPVVKSDEWLREAGKVLARKHSAVAYKEGPNLLPNGGLETLASDGLPEGWRRRDYNPASRGEAVRWEVVSGEGKTHSGKAALRAVSKDGVDTSFFADVELKPGAEYRLSGWIKTKGLSGKASFNDHINRFETEKVTKNSDWTEVDVTYSPSKGSKASLNILFVGKGEAIFDDVKLCEVTPVDDERVVSGDAQRGETLFWKHPTAACVLCHALKGQGSNVGPALDGIAGRKDAQYIKQSLLEPNAVLAQGFEYLKVSPMPPMGLVLSAQELADIEAFLQTLK